MLQFARQLGSVRLRPELARSSSLFILVVLVLGSVSFSFGQESSRDAAFFFADVVNYQNAGEFELAADEWKKFVAKYPNDPLAPKAQNYLAVCQLQLKRYSDAIANFETVLKKYPQADFRQEALLNLASANYAWAQNGNASKYQDAAKNYTAFLKQYPKSEFAAQSSYFLAESLYHSGQKEKAVQAYQDLAKQFPKSDLAADAVYAAGVTLEELGQFEKAESTYSRFLSLFPASELRYEVTMRKGESLLQQGQYKQAKEILTAVTKVESFEFADHALYRLAFCEIQNDDMLSAGNTYAQIPIRFPKSNYAQEATMLAGRCFYRSGHFDDAAKWLAAAGKSGGKYEVEAGHWLARVYLKQGKPEAAQSLAMSLVGKAGDDFAVQLKLDLADAVYDQPAKRSEAIALYRKIAQEHSKSDLAPQALYNAAFAALETKQYANAASLVDQFAKQYPEDEAKLDVAYVGAEAKLQAGQLAAAEEDLQRLVSEGKERAEHDRWQLRLALSQYLQKKYDQTQATVDRVSRKLSDPDLIAQAQFLLGASAFQLDKFDAALSALSKSIAASTTWPQADDARLMLARSQFAVGQTAQAVQTANDTLNSYPDSEILDQVQFRLAEFEFAEQQFSNAARAYRTVVRRWPKSPLVPHALYGEGWAYLKLSKPDQAKQVFGELIQKHSDHELAADAYTGRAMALRQSGDFKNAISDLQFVITHGKTELQKREAKYLLGVSLVETKDFAKAVQVFESLHQQSPDFANDDKVLYELAWAERSSGKEDRAVDHFRELATKYPDSSLVAEAMYHVGQASYEAENYVDAETWFTKGAAQASSPDIGEKAIYKKAWSQFQQGKTEAALDGFGDQITKYPNGPLASDAIFMQAECFFKDDQYDAALTSYQRVDPNKLSSDDMRSLLLLHAGQAAGKQKLWNEARKWYDRFIASLPDSPLLGDAYYELGWIYFNEKNQRSAVDNFLRAAEVSRGVAGARARFMLGEIDFEEKKYEEAIRQFKKVVYGYGGEKSLDSVKTWQAKCAYEVGRCNEVQIRTSQGTIREELIVEAKKFYQIVVDRYPSSPEAKLAESRLEVLAKL